MFSTMRCFYVFVHGRLKWVKEPDGDPEATRPLGFYCHRYVLASAADQAMSAAFYRVRKNLEERTCWMSDGLAVLELEAEEISIAPLHKLLKPDNKEHTFYDQR